MGISDGGFVGADAAAVSLCSMRWAHQFRVESSLSTGAHTLVGVWDVCVRGSQKTWQFLYCVTTLLFFSCKNLGPANWQ